jgi:hypothetical protein
MMTKWDTIQADVSDAYVYLDEEEAYNKALEEGNISLLDVDDFDEDELSKSLTLDWESYE